MGICMSVSSASTADQDLKSVTRTLPSKRLKWGESARGLLDRWIDPEKAQSRRQLSENHLDRVQGRMVVNGASGTACLFTQQGRKGPNQDAMVVWENFGSREDTVFCGVFDGHGPLGHMVAKKVRDSLPLKVCDEWKSVIDGKTILDYDDTVSRTVNPDESVQVNPNEEWKESVEHKKSENFPEAYTTLRQSLLKAFKLMDKELKLHPAIDCFCSGSTAVALIKQGHDLILGNIGDSRAVLGTRDMNNTMVALQLTVDLKPNLPRESARIKQCRGRVFALQDEPDVPRIWLPNSDSPGLAMTRAFGDFCLKDYGLISVPDISYRYLTDQDEFIVLATDGVWDVLSNKEVVDIVAGAPTRSTAARTLVDFATSEWRVKFPTSKIDDCAVVCLFLKPPTFKAHSEQNAAGLSNQCPTTAHPVVDDCQLQGNALQEMFPPVGIDEMLPIEEEEENIFMENIQSVRKLPNDITEEEWTALDGVARVDTILNLPRFSNAGTRADGKKN